MPPMRISMITRSGLRRGISLRPSSPLEAVVSSISGGIKDAAEGVLHVRLVIDQQELPCWLCLVSPSTFDYLIQSIFLLSSLPT